MFEALPIDRSQGKVLTGYFFLLHQKPYPMFIFTSLKATKQAHFSPCHLHFLPFQIVPNQVQPGTLFTGTGTNPYYGGA